MRNNSIRSLLRIPGYKIKEIISEIEGEIHIRIEPHKRNEGICSGCGKGHRGIHSIQEMIAEDMRLGELQVFLHIPKRRSECP